MDFFQLLVFTALQGQADTTQYIAEGRRNSIEQQKKPYVILISGDGFRYDYAKKYQAKNLLALSNKGVQAKSMIPSYPSLTFPNHYTIVTGLYPSHHGLVNNGFYDAARQESYAMSNKAKVEDGTWYKGTPLWVLAEKQKMLTASFYWVGSEADIQGTFPSYYYRYSEKIPIERRIEIVKDWLQLPAEKRPHLITFYFPEVDHEGHTFGPEAPETEKAVQKLDSSVAQLVSAVKSTGLPVSFVFVSDHGMTTVDTANTLRLPEGIDTSQFIINGEGNLLEMYAKDKNNILPAYQILNKNENQYAVYLKAGVPANLHYGKADDKYNRIGDLLVLAAWPKVFNLRNRKVNPGAHGYPPLTVKDMQATFYAWGPAFKSHVQIPSFTNVNVYPMIARVLGLKIINQIDGRLSVLQPILKRKK